MVEKFGGRIPKESYQEEPDDFADTEGLPIEGANDPVFINYVVEESVSDGVNEVAEIRLTRDDFTEQALARLRDAHNAKVAEASGEGVIKSEEEQYAEAVGESIDADTEFQKNEATIASAITAQEPRLTRDDFDPKMIMLRKLKQIPEPGDFQAPDLASPQEVEEIISDEELQKRGLITAPLSKIKPAEPRLYPKDFTEAAIIEAREKRSRPPELPRPALGSEFPEDFKIDRRLRTNNATASEVVGTVEYFPDTVPGFSTEEAVETVYDEHYEVAPDTPPPLTRDAFTVDGIIATRIKEGTAGKTYYPPANSVPIKYAPKSIPKKSSLLKRLVPSFLKRWFS